MLFLVKRKGYNKGKIMRNCKVCGKECYGHECQECFRKGKYGSISRVKIIKRYKMRKNDGSTINSETDSEIQ